MGTQGTPQLRKVWTSVIKQITKIYPNTIAGGSYRRGAESCRDLDLMLITPDGNMPDEVIKKMMTLGYTFVERGKKKATAISGKGYQVDLYATNEMHSGSTLLHITGSKEFNIGMRSSLAKKGMTFSENGLLDRNTKKMIASRSEEEIFHAMGYEFIPPEERVDYFNATKGRKLVKAE
jgi:DNA polymerase (family 10)